jgi:hypothetical protein
MVSHASTPKTKLNLASEQGRFITPPAKLKRLMCPFDYRVHSGIKDSHVKVFSDVSKYLEIVILVRATNPKSIQWMGKKGYIPKPLDCKAKTAKKDALIEGRTINCAGLVVYPDLLGASVFDNDFAEKQKNWQEFKKALHEKKMNSGCTVYLRSERGFYAVDTHNPEFNNHYGCLMICEQNPPENFDPSKSETRTWMRNNNMGYIHGDYDLYGIIDQSEESRPKLGETHKIFVNEGYLLGQKHNTTALSSIVIRTLNNWMACEPNYELVKHGEETARGFKGDEEVYIFYPWAGVDVISKNNFKQDSEMANYFEELYRYVFKTEYVRY